MIEQTAPIQFGSKFSHYLHANNEKAEQATSAAEGNTQPGDEVTLSAEAIQLLQGQFD